MCVCMCVCLYVCLDVREWAREAVSGKGNEGLWACVVVCTFFGPSVHDILKQTCNSIYTTHTHNEWRHQRTLTATQLACEIWVSGRFNDSYINLWITNNVRRFSTCAFCTHVDRKLPANKSDQEKKKKKEKQEGGGKKLRITNNVRRFLHAFRPEVPRKQIRPREKKKKEKKEGGGGKDKRKQTHDNKNTSNYTTNITINHSYDMVL